MLRALISGMNPYYVAVPPSRDSQPVHALAARPRAEEDGRVADTMRDSQGGDAIYRSLWIAVPTTFLERRVWKCIW